MQFIILLSAILAASLCGLESRPARAQGVQANSSVTYVSRSGSDVNTCGAIASPCRTLSQGVARTSAGSAVECLDAVDLVSVTITKSITITCDSAKWGNGAVGGFYPLPFTINVAAADIVTIRGFTLHGIRYSSGFSAITFDGAGTLILDNVVVEGFTGSGVLFQPNGPAKLILSNSLIAGNGDFSNNTGAGVRVVPQSGGTAQVSISRTNFSRNVFGIAVDGSSSTGGINATIMDSVMTGSANDGVVGTSSPSTAPAGVSVINSRSINNGFGIRSIGSNITVRVKNTEIIGNTMGLSGGGALLSGGGNSVQANATNGVFTGSYPLQ